MKSSNSTTKQLDHVRVAAVHASSIFFDVSACVAKCVKLIKEASDAGVELVVFPESFIPGFPIWNALKNPIDGHDFFTRFAKSSIQIDGVEIAEIAKTAASCKIAVSLGFSERASYSEG